MGAEAGEGVDFEVPVLAEVLVQAEAKFVVDAAALAGGLVGVEGEVEIGAIGDPITEADAAVGVVFEVGTFGLADDAVTKTNRRS